jgi:imidazolonepropionase-like amidohydrolase
MVGRLVKSPRTLITAAKLFDGRQDKTTDAPAILIEGERIAAVGVRGDFGTDVDAIQAHFPEGWIMPGLFNAHVHLTFMYLVGDVQNQMAKSQTEDAIHAARVARLLLAQGVTSARDMGGRFGIPIVIRDLISRGELIGPTLTTCGQPLSVTGGHAWDFSLECDGPDGFRRGARTQLKNGADFVKVMASHDPWTPGFNGQDTRPELSAAEMQAAVGTAHDWARLATCHVMGSQAIDRAIDAGVDILEHGHYLTIDQAHAMAKRGLYLTPTLSSYDSQTMNRRFGRGDSWAAAHEQLVAPHRAAIRNAVEAGVGLLVGTDSVGLYWEEVELLREFGLSPAESLRSCTSTAARAFGTSDRVGTIEAGKRADLVLLGADPLIDARALRNVIQVVKAGCAWDPADLVAFEQLQTDNLVRLSE